MNLRRWAMPIKATVREALDRHERRARRRRRRFYARIMGRGDLCFDIGANVGNRTDVFRSLGAHVIAVEPQPDLAAYLRARFATRVTVVEAATGATSGSAELHLSSSHTVASMSTKFIDKARTEGWFGQDVRWSGEITVPLVTLDWLIQEHGSPRFIKIDVEGSEPEVLAGLSTPVPWISFEYTDHFPELAQHCVTHLRAIGDYEFCYSVGETFEWITPTFTSGDEVLAAAGGSGPWGDIYARLRKNARDGRASSAACGLFESL